MRWHMNLCHALLVDVVRKLETVPKTSAVDTRKAPPSALTRGTRSQRSFKRPLPVLGLTQRKKSTGLQEPVDKGQHVWGFYFEAPCGPRQL
jgi:hypothetical protein